MIYFELYTIRNTMSNVCKKPKLIAVVGPTASGKSALAIRIARWLGSSVARKKYGIRGAEIVSADSRQIYRGMDIGTAKPRLVASGKWLVTSRIPHYLIDIKNPDEPYTLAEYKRDALAAIRGILKRKKMPIMVGGTGLYVQVVIDNWEIPDVKPNAKLREEIEKRIEKEGLESLYRELVERDPEAAYIVDGKNSRRVVRALEIALTTQRSFSAQRKKGPKLFNALKIGVALPHDALREQIEKRVDGMIRGGLFSEIKTLIKKYGDRYPAFDAISYREVIDYANGKLTRDEAVAAIKKNTWHYAKRQMTWFRKDKEIRWIQNEKEAKKLVEDFLQ